MSKWWTLVAFVSIAVGSGIAGVSSRSAPEPIVYFRVDTSQIDTGRPAPTLCVFVIPPAQLVRQARIELARCGSVRWNVRTEAWVCDMGLPLGYIPVSLDGGKPRPVECTP